MDALLILILGGSIIVFFVMRSVMLWYWKIDEILSNQSLQNRLINDQNQLLREALKIRPTADKMPEEEIEKKAKLYDQSQK